jgi:hypothetical protein
MARRIRGRPPEGAAFSVTVRVNRGFKELKKGKFKRLF